MPNSFDCVCTTTCSGKKCSNRTPFKFFFRSQFYISPKAFHYNFVFNELSVFNELKTVLSIHF